MELPLLALPEEAGEVVVEGEEVLDEVEELSVEGFVSDLVAVLPSDLVSVFSPSLVGLPSLYLSE